jgi:hypothetical protein
MAIWVCPLVATEKASRPSQSVARLASDASPRCPDDEYLRLAAALARVRALAQVISLRAGGMLRQRRPGGG